MLVALELYERAPGPEIIGALATALERTDGYLGHIELAGAPSNDQRVGALDNESIVFRSPTSGRNIKSEEWEPFGWSGEAHHETCPQWVDEV